MKYRVEHITTLSYPVPVSAAGFNLRLIPAKWPGHAVSDWGLFCDPPPAVREDLPGPYWVNTTRISFAAPLQRLRIVSRFTVDVTPNLPRGDGPALEVLRDEALAARDISPVGPAPYLFASRVAAASRPIADWAAEQMPPGAAIVPTAAALMSAIHGQFAYVPGATDSTTPPDAAFRLRKGVCQDFAHVMIVGLRAAGIPAAYVSGYLRTDPPPGKPRLIGCDAMHAWVNVWCGAGLGWIGFDPTNDCLAGDGHILIGMGRDYADVAPIDGTFVGGAPQAMDSAVDVLPVA